MEGKHVSIIIPTYNEEENLALLLESIRRQNYDNCEVIVSDANSTDGTVWVAKSYGCKVIEGGLPALGKNNGARAAERDLFIFLDADTILPDNFLYSTVGEFYLRDLDIAGINLVPISESRFDRIFHKFYNVWQKAMQKIDPHLSGACIFIRKEGFFNVGCFDEDLVVAEDHALARKAKRRNYNLGILDNFVFLNVRRLEKEGRVGVALKFVFFWFRRLFGEIRKSNVKYELRDR